MDFEEKNQRDIRVLITTIVAMILANMQYLNFTPIVRSFTSTYYLNPINDWKYAGIYLYYSCY